MGAEKIDPIHIDSSSEDGYGADHVNLNSNLSAKYVVATPSYSSSVLILGSGSRTLSPVFLATGFSKMSKSLRKSIIFPTLPRPSSVVL